MAGGIGSTPGGTKVRQAVLCGKKDGFKQVLIRM